MASDWEERRFESDEFDHLFTVCNETGERYSGIKDDAKRLERL
jgi:hypothetical protein